VSSATLLARSVTPRSVSKLFLPYSSLVGSLPLQLRLVEHKTENSKASMEMANAQNGKHDAVEWRVTAVPEGASVTVEHEAGGAARAWAWLVSCVLTFRDTVLGSAERVWRIGADDPRKAVHALKVGLALALVSVFYYTRPLYDSVGGAAMWAIMTVVVVFEYTVGKLQYCNMHVNTFKKCTECIRSSGTHLITS
jgi:uncharacterized membrane protein